MLAKFTAMKNLERWLEETTEVEALDLDLERGLELFDLSFNLVTKEQLPQVGYYLERLSHLWGEHAEQWWLDWSRRRNGSELGIEADFFDCYLQQSVGFDADIYLDALPNGEREYRPSTKPVKIPSAKLEAIIDESHAEDVPGWSEQIESYLQLHGNSSTLAELIGALSLTPGAIIYTLLLGNFQLEQKGEDFYGSDSLEVRLCQHR